MHAQFLVLRVFVEMQCAVGCISTVLASQRSSSSSSSAPEVIHMLSKHVHHNFKEAGLWLHFLETIVNVQGKHNVTGMHKYWFTALWQSREALVWHCCSSPISYHLHAGGGLSYGPAFWLRVTRPRFSTPPQLLLRSMEECHILESPAGPACAQQVLAQ